MAGFGAAFTAFVTAAAALVLLLFGTALGVASAQEITVEGLQAPGATIKRWGGWVLVAEGSWFTALALWTETFARLLPL